MSCFLLVLFTCGTILPKDGHHLGVRMDQVRDEAGEDSVKAIDCREVMWGQIEQGTITIHLYYFSYRHLVEPFANRPEQTRNYHILWKKIV